MKAQSRWIVWVLFLLGMAAPVWAAEEKPAAETPPPATEVEEEKLGRILLEVSSWIALPVGLEYTPAVRFNQPGSTASNSIQMPTSEKETYRLRFGYSFRKNIGDFVVTWWSHDREDSLAEFNPGNFIFGMHSLLPYPAGVFNDGLADGFTSFDRTETRDLRIDFSRVGVNVPRISVRWYVGYRHTTHSRDFQAAYYAIRPDLPPVQAPEPAPLQGNLDPFPDFTRTTSAFRGRGPEAGVEITMPIRKKFAFEANLGLALLRGTIKTKYSYKMPYYAVLASRESREIARKPLFLQADINNDGVLETLTITTDQPWILEPPYSEFDTDLASLIFQFTAAGTLEYDDTASAQVIDASLGFRWIPWRDLQVLLGFRSLRLTDAGLDVRPTTSRVLPSGQITLDDVSRTHHAILYEGAYLGVGYKF